MQSTTLLFVAAVCCGALEAGAESVINIDFQPGPSGATFASDYAGPGALADDANHVWNAVAPPVDGYTSAWGCGFGTTWGCGRATDRCWSARTRQTPMMLRW